MEVGEAVVPQLRRVAQTLQDGVHEALQSRRAASASRLHPPSTHPQPLTVLPRFWSPTRPGALLFCSERDGP